MNRLRKFGEKSLTDSELLSILLADRNDNSHEKIKNAVNLLDHFNNDLKELFSSPFERLIQIGGINPLDAYHIKAVFELAQRMLSFSEEKRPTLRTAHEIVLLVAPSMVPLKQERFKVVLFDQKGTLICHKTVSVGTLDSTYVHPRDVFKPAVMYSAASLILVHNHPSGDPTPSEMDISMTKELRLCGTILGIEVEDHIIIASSGYTSMKLKNLM